jgi:hypothetical protein
MRRKQRQTMLAAGVLAAAGVLVALMAYPQIANARDVQFRQSWNAIAYETVELTKEYQAEEGKWKAGQYDNATMAGIVDRYLPRYQSLIDRAGALDTPEKYAESRDLLVKAIRTEKEGNEHFKAYLLTGDPKEYKRSVDLINLSLQYSAEADAAVRAAG